MKKSWVPLVCIATLGFHAAATAGSEDELVFPILTPEPVGTSTCDRWDVDIYAVAAPYPKTSLSRIMGAKIWGKQFKLYQMRSGDKPEWGIAGPNARFMPTEPTVNLSGDSVEERVANVNKSVFGDPNPAIGTRVYFAHAGKYGAGGSGDQCYSRPDFECVGGAIATEENGYTETRGNAEMPNLFPPGTQCGRISITPGTCVFDAPSAVINYGVVGPDGATQVVDLVASCSGVGSGIFQISMLGGGTTVSSDKVSVKLTADGKTLPTQVNLSDGKNNVPVGASATAVKGQSGEFSLTAVLLLQAM